MEVSSNVNNEHLQRGLKERHIQLIALGGAIGVGLFLGSSYAIKMAGPAIILSYAIAAITVFVLMRCLGEMAVETPISGSFSAYAAKYISPRAGFITAWMYWMVWMTAGMAEITAVAVYCTYWWPALPQWIPALGALIAMTVVNMTAVKFFGEFEFWFAIIKVVTIIALIILGVGMIFFGVGVGEATGVSNLYALEGGFMPHGMYGVLSAMTVAVFAFLGTELIGVTAGEAENPEKTIPSAINKVIYRIVLFYILALTVIMAIFPWNEIGSQGSPFVLVFQGVGIGPAAGIINFVVLTAAMSSCNSGIFSTGRMMYTLSLQGQGPKAFATLNRNGVPYVGVLFSACVLCIGVMLNYVAPESVFQNLVSACTFLGVWVWLTIVATHFGFRKKLTREQTANLKYPSILYPYANWLCLVVLGFVMFMLAYNPDLRSAFYVGPAWLIILYIAHVVRYSKTEKIS